MDWLRHEVVPGVTMLEWRTPIANRATEHRDQGGGRSGVLRGYTSASRRFRSRTGCSESRRPYRPTARSRPRASTSMHFTMQAAFLTTVPSVYQPHDLQHLHLPRIVGAPIRANARQGLPGVLQAGEDGLGRIVVDQAGRNAALRVVRRPRPRCGVRPPSSASTRPRRRPTSALPGRSSGCRTPTRSIPPRPFRTRTISGSSTRWRCCVSGASSCRWFPPGRRTISIPSYATTPSEPA